MSATARESQAPCLNVLLVEDSADDAELIALELKRGGLNPVCRRVETAAELKRALGEGHWDLVLSDYGLSAFPLAEALELIRERELDVPVLVVSAATGEEAAVAAMKAGAHDYILKHRLGRLVPAVTRELRESAVRQERRSLEEQLRQAQKMQSIGLLAGGVAHDFNNLLTGIVGNASLVMDILNPGDPVRFMLQEVISASERATHLTRQLLAYAGKGTFVLEPIGLSRLVQETTDLLRSTAGRGVEVKFDLAGDVPEIQADAGQVRQVLMNLLMNASEAIGEQPGSITVRTFGLCVRPGERLEGCVPRSPAPGSYACLQVVDSGCGIGAEAMTQIFDPFFTTRFAGRGLGLAAVLGIVRRHKGAVQVQSVEGRGSTFTVLLASSVNGTGLAAPVPGSAADTPLTGTGVILVVDDEEVVRHAARASLEHYGYTVFEACDGQDGVDLFLRLRERVSVVLLDLTMPNMNGQQACERIRRVRPDVRVLISSGFDECEARRRFRDHNRMAFIQKPYTAAELASKMKSVLGRQ